MKRLEWLLAGLLVLGVTIPGFAQDDMPAEEPEQDQPVPQEEENQPGATEQEEEKQEEEADPYQWIVDYIKRIADRAELTEDEQETLIAELKKLQKKIDEAREEAKTALKDALGEERFTELERRLARFFGDGQRGGRGQGGRGGPQGGLGGMIEQLGKDLGLDEETLTRFKELQGEFETTVQEIFREARQNGPQGFRDAFDQVRQEMDGLLEKMKDGLDEEQQQKLDEMFQQFRDRFGGRGGRGNRGGGNQGD